MSDAGTARLFIALELPEPVREALAGWACRAARSGGPLRADPGRMPAGKRSGGARHALRLAEPETMHITLAFLGQQPLELLGALGALIEDSSAAGLKALALGAPLWLPTRRPRALAVEVREQGESLRSLRRLVLHGLEELSIAPAQPRGSGALRAFHPHITVARLRSGTRVPERVLPPTPSLSFLPDRLVLYRSYLSAQGARHVALAAGATHALS